MEYSKWMLETEDIRVGGCDLSKRNNIGVLVWENDIVQKR